MNIVLSGKTVLLFERAKNVLTRTVTAKAEEKAIRSDNFISPAGTISFVKHEYSYNSRFIHFLRQKQNYKKPFNLVCSISRPCNVFEEPQGC
jgi:hypothetical protein